MMEAYLHALQVGLPDYSHFGVAVVLVLDHVSHTVELFLAALGLLRADT